MRRLVRILWALGSLALLTVGVPWVLVRFVGAPLPRSMPRLGEIIPSIERTGVDPRTVAKLLALIVWAAWVRLIIALAVELLAAMRRRPTPTVRGLGSAQRWAASIVASSSIVMSLVGVGRPVGASALPVPTMAMAWSGGGLISDGAELEPAASATTTTTWTVQRNDSWWRIAERSTGDGMRWRDVLAANIGREVAPGVVFASADLALQPGWSIVVPDDAPTPTLDPVASDTVTVLVGDSLSSIAQDRLGSSDRWAEVWELNEHHAFADGRTFDDPDLLRPGWVLTLPVPPESATSPGPQSFASTSSTISPAATAATAATLPPIADDAVDPPASCAPPVATFAADEQDARPLGVGAATLAATLGLGVVRARRRRQLRAATRGTTLPEPTDALITFEQTMDAASAEELVARVELAVRSLVAELAERAEAGVAASRLVAVLTDPDGRIELVIDGDAPAPIPPFSATDRGWALAATVPTIGLPAGARYASFPCPALVQIGRSGDRDVWLDLEAVGLLVVEGSRRHGRAVLHHLVATVALAPFGVRSRLIGVGVDTAAFEAAEGAQPLDDLDAVLEVAVDHLTPLLGVLRPGWSSAALRVRSAGEPWEPVVAVVGADAVVGASAGDLGALAATPGRGLAVVTDAPSLRARWRLRQLDSTWRLEPLGLELRPVGFEVPDLRSLADLVASADRPVTRVAPRTEPAPTTGPWRLMVHTYGRPRVTATDGTEIAFARSKALELVVWLARHRRAGTRAGARGALWDAEVANGTFANVVSDARNALGTVTHPAGDAWIARTTGERLELAPGVVTDTDVLEQAVAAARRQDPATARRTLNEALELVVGPPFATAAYVWPDAEGLVSGDTLLATTAAAELAELCLAANDLDGVFAATAIGLGVLPGHEELLALRMRAHAVRGDLAAVRSEWDGYERVIANDPLGDGEPAARLVQLRNDLLGRRR